MNENMSNITKNVKEIPISKIYEAYSAIADERIMKKSDDLYFVKSSDESKVYTIHVSDLLYTSNDNATVWQHYAGYPIIAVMIYQKRLSFDEDVLIYFKNVNWKELNTKHKNKYDESIAEFLSAFETDKKEAIEASVAEIKKQLKSLEYQVKGNREKILASFSV